MFYIFLTTTLIYALGILWASIQPETLPLIPDVIYTLGDAFRNFLHIPAYFGLAALLFTTMKHYKGRAGGLIPDHIARWSFWIPVCYGIINEFVQSHVPGRTFSIGDMLRNALGAFLAVWV
ncbi:MAG: VanZ family protein, partial [Candidatus Omnitrophota bacterium]